MSRNVVVGRGARTVTQHGGSVDMNFGSNGPQMRIALRNNSVFLLDDSGVRTATGVYVHRFAANAPLSGMDLVINDDNLSFGDTVVHADGTVTSTARPVASQSSPASSGGGGGITMSSENRRKSSAIAAAPGGTQKRQRGDGAPKSESSVSRVLAAAATAASSSAAESAVVAAQPPSSVPTELFSLLQLDWDAISCQPVEPLVCPSCESNKRDVLLRPCGHVPFCITCAGAHAAAHVASLEPAPCPVCKTHITSANHVFL
jgi:Zinc finger, C3HC4 type (RING finger)